MRNVVQRPRRKFQLEEAHVFKGQEFEREVAAWLKAHYGCTQASRNERVQLTVNARPFECDVHAVRGSALGRSLRRLGGAFLLVALAAYLLGRLGVETTLYLYLFALLGVGCFVVSFLVKGQREQHVWVECKNLKGNVNRDQVNKVATTVALARQSQCAPWKPDLVLFFSATDYDRDALYFARRNGIACYRRSRGKFVRAR
jgi:hypothetical protein